MGPKPVASGGSGVSRGGARWGVAFDSIRLDAAQLSLQDALLHRGAELHLTMLAGTGLQGEHPHFSLTGEQGGAGYGIDGSVGPVRRLLDAADRRTDWPVSIQADETVAGAVVGHGQAAGVITDPAHARGYDLTMAAAMTQLGALNRLFAHARLPEMQGLDASWHVVDMGHPSVVSLRAKAGPTVIPGARDLMLQSWSASAATASAPIEVAASGMWKGQPMVLRGTAASLEAVQTAESSVPVRLSLALGMTNWHVDGVAGRARSDVRLQGSIPDRSTLGGLTASPDLGPMTLDARLQTDQGTSFRLSDLKLASAAGDLEGALSLSLRGGRPMLTGTLSSTRIDVDRLARWRAADRPDQARGTPAPAARPAPAAAPSSEAALPWPVLRLGDADLSLQAADLLIGGQHYRDFVTHAVLQDGRLLMQPQASGPAGVITARLQLDAGASPPKLDVWMHPVMLPAAMLTKLLGGSDEVRGTVELVGELQAAGESRSALAATATGHVGASMTDGVVATAGLARLIGGSSAITAVLPTTGETAVRCLALHAGLAGGQADIDTLSLHTGRLSVDGHGRVALANGALEMHLRPFAQVGSAWISLPVLLGGSLHDPHPALDRATGGRYALTIGGGGAAPADCTGPLQAAREGVAGPAPGAVDTAAVQTGTGGKQKKPKVIDILRGLGILH